MRPDRLITTLLFALVLLDLFLCCWGFFAPELWFAFFHDAPRVDPQALLPRSAANWAGFLLLQTLALVRWRRRPGWLLIVAGCRLCDMFTDLTCLLLCERISTAGAVLFPVAGAFNLVVGLALVRLHARWLAELPREEP